MKRIRLTAVRAIAAAVFVFAFMLNIHTNFEGETSLFGQPLIGQTGTGTGSGSGSGSEQTLYKLEEVNCTKVCCLDALGHEVTYVFGKIKGCFEGSDPSCNPEGNCGSIYNEKKAEVDAECDSRCS
ncbi:hypothetical protein [Parapedobacter sp. 10938]|uniref:hypothetical protein n=1 Tax=Parapedobacter flavus TaxID=3110225 RepID=UPI002DB7D16F|nr:hypothetical protein [Parapedobacter sp. 10938]MEC3880617.1 hypothetical protein [Parapedobacter sp. 10938]